MHFALISKILGLLLVVFSFTMMPPVAVAGDRLSRRTC